MNVAAITKFKQGDLFMALKKAGWSQAELARRAGINPSDIGRIINMKQRPSLRMAEKIQVALGEAGVYLDILEVWPESFAGFEKTPVLEQVKEVPLDHLLQHHYARQQPLLELDKKELYETVEGLLQTIPDRERKALEARFFEGKTMTEVGRLLGSKKKPGQSLTVCGANTLVNRGLRKLTHPTRWGRLCQAMDVVEGLNTNRR